MRRNWKDWAGLVAGALVLLAGIALTGGLAQLLLAWTLGTLSTFAFVGWFIGGDVASLPWVWGAVGEQATGELLEKLPADWHVEHDVVYRYGNWDHIVVGAAGVFLLDSKNIRGKAVAKDDALCSGRLRYAGGSFRGAAVGLKEALEAEVGPPLFVNAVAVVWGDFPQQRVEQTNVTYIAAGRLIEWLQGLPPKLTPARRDALVAGAQRLALSAEAAPVPQLELAQTVART